MSSTYPPSYGGVPVRFCARCGKPLPPNNMHCSNCGYYNVPPQGNAPASGAPPPSWGGSPQSPSQGNPGFPQRTPPPASWGSGNSQPPSQGSPNAPVKTPPPVSWGGVSPQTSQSGMNVPPGPSVPPSWVGASPQPPSAQARLRLSQNIPPASGQSSNPQQVPFPPSGEPENLNGAPTQFIGGEGQAPALPQPVRRPRWLVIIGTIIVLGALITTGVFGSLWLMKGGSGPGSEASATSLPKPKGAALFTDSFKDNTHQWNLQGIPGKANVSVEGGSLTLEDNDHKLLWEVVPGNKTFTNFTLMTDATLSKGDETNGYGICIRGALNDMGELATYYRFELYGDGTYAIFKGTVDDTGKVGSTKLVDYTTHPAIQKRGKINHIVITANGSSLSLVVNGQNISTISDNSYTSGSVSLFVSNLQEAQAGAQAKFSNFGIYENA